MRLFSVVVLGVAATAIAACSDDDFTGPTKPPTAAVRLVNGMSSASAVDIRAVEQVEWTPTANVLAYRHATPYFPTEAKAMRLRVFQACQVAIPATCTPEAVSTVYLDTTITFIADSRVTLLLTGTTTSARFIMIGDDVTAPNSGDIGIRLVNASTGAIDGYVTAAAADPLPGTPTFTAAAGPGATSGYISRPAGAATARITAGGVPAPVLATGVGASAPNPLPGTPQNPGAGVTSPGTKFSVYFFPQVGSTAATVLWLVDRNPAD